MTEKPDRNSTSQSTSFTLRSLIPKVVLSGLLSLAGYFLAYLIGEGLKLLINFIVQMLIPH